MSNSVFYNKMQRIGYFIFPKYLVDFPVKAPGPILN